MLVGAPDGRWPAVIPHMGEHAQFVVWVSLPAIEKRRRMLLALTGATGLKGSNCVVR